MTVTPIFDDLVATWSPTPDPRRRSAPRPRPASPAGVTSPVVGTAAFGRGCLEGDVEDHGRHDDEVTRLLEGARREAVALGRRWVDSVHLLLAAVRAGGDVGRAFGMRGAGPAVLLAALDDGADGGDELVGGDPARPALSSVARTVLHRAGHRAARAGRTVTAVELAVAVARTGRVADLLGRLGVDLDDLVDALDALDAVCPADAVGPVGPVGPVGLAPTAHPAGPRRPLPVPVGVVAPVTVMRPGPAAAVAAVVPDDHAADVPA